MPESFDTSKNQIAIEGLNEMIETFKKLGADALNKAVPSVDAAGDIVLEKVKSHLPDGQLKNSMFLKRPKPRNATTYFNILTWGDDCRDYGAPLELGHAIRFIKRGKIYGHVDPYKGTGFLRPGADEAKDEALDEIVDEMDNIISSYFSDMRG